MQTSFILQKLSEINMFKGFWLQKRAMYEVINLTHLGKIETDAWLFTFQRNVCCKMQTEAR